MKRILIALNVIVLVGVCAALLAYWRKDPPPRPHPIAVTLPPVAEPESAVALAPSTPDQPSALKRPIPAAAPERSPGTPARPIQPVTPPPANDLRQVISFALDPNTTYAQRQEVWNNLRETGLLDEAMKELEERAQAEPSNAVIPASLGQLCLFKAGQMTNSIADQGLLGMKADKVFDQALSLDPSNWEARLWKATAMSYWPAVLNKSQEVMGHFVALIEQQEAQTPQPHFAQTYALLGQEYVKSGHADFAKDIWQRGLLFFPNDSGLKEKLAILEK